METSWAGRFAYGIFWFNLKKNKKLRSGVTNYIHDIDACKGSGKEIFADFSDWACCPSCDVCTEQGLGLPTSLIIITHSWMITGVTKIQS